MKVFVANRGEVAARIVRSFTAQGIPCIVPFVASDAEAPHVWLADEAVELPDRTAHLNGALLTRLAQERGATHMHPGYGFLSQSPEFVRQCSAAGIVFLGPSAEAMSLVGDKSQARALAESLGIPTVPGAHLVHNVSELLAIGDGLGFPLLLKAAGGGGGRGMRQVHDSTACAAAFAAAAREAQNSSGDARLLVERFIAPARHIEVQVVADGKRARIAGDRECSLQRRYQKIIEEAPATVLDDRQRAALHDHAARLVQAASYCGICTVEFLLGPDGAIYFLEINPRLQVEHPVTECCAQIDLVALQFALAQGQSVESLGSFAPRGHAIEVRLMAEDPGRNFLPQTGNIALVQWPVGPGIRVDAGVVEGMQITPDFDPLLAKIIAWAPQRDVATRALIAALDETVVLGVSHNQMFLRDTLAGAAFASQQTFTQDLERRSWQPTLPSAGWQAAMHNLTPANNTPAQAQTSDPWSTRDGFGRLFFSDAEKR